MVEALRYWPGFRPVTAAAVDISVLVPFLDARLGALPWWNPAWRVVEVRAASPCFTSTTENRVVEVSVPGKVGGEGGSLPFSARVRFEGDRLLRFQAKIGDMVIGPAATVGDTPEPDPFGAVVARLIDLRGLPASDVARRAGISMSTVRCLRGGWTPDPVIVRRLAEALDMTADDLLAIARLEP
ncbi:helix-turn-helix transcriptional regulator [Asanoa sp. NPDC050611]|uniref:helix-turn-helix domain-containing protein n=1 Tax=Asanoa sp. NPDC050611 TaxID=3157098 RepID=UPI0033FE2211